MAGVDEVPPLRKVVLVGVNHGFQFGPPVVARRHVEDFLARVHALCVAHEVVAIAEEMSAEALEKWNVTESTCMDVVRTLSLEHRLCDPGIEDNRDHAYRERVWLRRLIELDRWPVLFVCGIAHLDTFAAVLVAAGAHVVVDERRWEDPLDVWSDD